MTPSTGSSSAPEHVDVVVLGWWAEHQNRIDFIRTIRDELSSTLGEAKRRLEDLLATADPLVLHFASRESALRVGRSIAAFGAEVRLLSGTTKPPGDPMALAEWASLRTELRRMLDAGGKLHERRAAAAAIRPDLRIPDVAIDAAMSTNRMRRVTFTLPRVDDEWPPADAEGVWAEEVEGGLYRIENVPFYAFGVSMNDLVRVVEDGGLLRFQEVVRYGGHRTLRMMVHDASRVQSLRDELRQMGCPSEGSNVAILVAIDVPHGVDGPAVRRWLEARVLSGEIAVEEAAIDW